MTRLRHRGGSATPRIFESIGRRVSALAANAWEELDPDQFPFTKSIAGQVREHDDREQFLTGVTARPRA
ncbi:hypothetical protein [Amycolatopsis sp. cmx-11-51]|uniref:hypothetical protein n=1 Tax=unclassified Amycolatopsis TaxID=2618356 RepID=UPI0039E43210